MWPKYTLRCNIGLQHPILAGDFWSSWWVQKVCQPHQEKTLQKKYNRLQRWYAKLENKLKTIQNEQVSFWIMIVIFLIFCNLIKCGWLYSRFAHSNKTTPWHCTIISSKTVVAFFFSHLTRMQNCFCYLMKFECCIKPATSPNKPISFSCCTDCLCLRKYFFCCDLY